MEDGLTRAQFNLVREMDEWLPYAKCKGRIGYTNDRPRNAKLAAEAEADFKEICRQCPVTINCLSHALNFPEPVGIWGGLNPEERKQLRNQHELKT